MITKAIIPVAGYGTRFLPITKTINKTMLPILNRPVVDYIVEDCVKAGIKDIIFIIIPGETQLKDYYSRNQNLEAYLLDRNARDKYQKIADIHKQANFHFVEQPQDGRYGTAIPPLLAQKFIEADEPFLVLMGDDIVFHSDGKSELKELIATYEAAGTDGAMACAQFSAKEIIKYAVVETTETGQYLHFKQMVEKPASDQVRSNLANISKYIFKYDMFNYIKKVQPNPENKEYYITDAINAYVADKHTVAVHKIRGQYLDGGTVEGWLKANDVVAKAQGLI